MPTLSELVRYGLSVASTLIVAWSSLLYIRAIRRGKEARPVLTTWILFTVATGLSMATYFNSPQHSLITNLAGVTDTTFVFVITVTVWRFGDRQLAFTKTQFVALLGAVAITYFWSTTSDANTATKLTQGILLIGYLPTYERLWKGRDNSEPSQSWWISLVGSGLVLLLACIDADLNVGIYATRAIVQTVVVLVLIRRIKLRTHTSGSAN